MVQIKVDTSIEISIPSKFRNLPESPCLYPHETLNGDEKEVVSEPSYQAYCSATQV